MPKQSIFIFNFMTVNIQNMKELIYKPIFNIPFWILK